MTDCQLSETDKMFAALLFFASLVNAATYYATTSPGSGATCSQAKPCAVSALPSLYGTSDVVVFLPGTGVYTFTKTLTNPSLVISSGCIFNGATLNSVKANSVTCNDTIFRASSSFQMLSATNVQMSRVSFVKTQFVLVPLNSVDTRLIVAVLEDITVTDLTAAQRFQVAGADITINRMNISNSVTSQAGGLLQIQSTNADAIIHANYIRFTNCWTSSATSVSSVKSFNGEEFTLVLNEWTYDNCTSSQAFLEMSNTYVPTVFYAGVDAVGFHAIGGSVGMGLIYLNNAAPSSSLSMNLQLMRADNVNFNNGPAFTLNTGSGTVAMQGLTNDNQICTPTNLADLAVCTGIVNSTTFTYSGADDGATTYATCPNTYVRTHTGCFSSTTTF